MSKFQLRLIVGGTAVVSMMLSNSMLLAAPIPFPAKTAKIIPPTPAYVEYVRGQDKFATVSKALAEETAKRMIAEANLAKQKEQEEKAKIEAAKIAAAKAAAPKPATTTKPKTSAPVQVASRSSTAVAPGLVDYALSLRGIPYKYGGTTTAGFDCSGFTQYVFAKYGVKLPRISFDQFKTGTAVAKGNLEPGDLVFFTTYAAGASHVGISLGGGDFVHASINGVKITSISGYYAERFLGGRRVR